MHNIMITIMTIPLINSKTGIPLPPIPNPAPHTFRLTLRSLGSSGDGEWEGWWWRGSASMLAPRSGDMRSSSSVMLMLIVVAQRVAERRGTGRSGNALCMGGGKERKK